METEVAMAIPQPDKVKSRENQCAVRTRMNSAPRDIYAAWTTGFDRWFAVPGTVRMEPEVGAEYSFETEHDGRRHAHRGKFLRLEKDSLIEMTWITGAGGTEGAETVLSVEIAEEGAGSLVDLKHAGFPNQESMQRHEQAWIGILSHLDKVLAGRAP
jgi:uncharacterized protein YndB with AHSA1/START domain